MATAVARHSIRKVFKNNDDKSSLCCLWHTLISNLVFFSLVKHSLTTDYERVLNIVRARREEIIVFCLFCYGVGEY
jgi:hypothetical protein